MKNIYNHHITYKEYFTSRKVTWEEKARSSRSPEIGSTEVIPAFCFFAFNSFCKNKAANFFSMKQIGSHKHGQIKLRKHLRILQENIEWKGKEIQQVKRQNRNKKENKTNIHYQSQLVAKSLVSFMSFS